MINKVLQLAYGSSEPWGRAVKQLQGSTRVNNQTGLRVKGRRLGEVYGFKLPPKKMKG